ncbi:MAG: ARPP-1 family domain-containing protein, partial [Anaerolineae bacterium]
SQGTVEVTEVSVGGSVPELSVVNRGGRPVLIPEGAILSGAKQNRVVNVTVLVAPESTYTLPVSCVERGRWGMKTSKRAMADAGYAPPSLRFSALEGVNTSRSLGLGARSDQVRVWTEVSHISAAADADSPTDSLSDVLDAAEGGRRRYREAITLPDGACGFVAGLGGDVIGVELFGYASVMSAVSPTLIDGYFAHAAWSPAEPEPTALEDAQAFIEQVSAGLHAVDGVGDLGVEMAVDGPGVVGQALVYADRLCRLAAIRHQEDD